MRDRLDLEKLAGKGNQQMSEDNNRNFARFMESLFAEFRANVLVDIPLFTKISDDAIIGLEEENVPAH